MKFSQVPALGVRACMSSSTPWSLSVLTLSVRSVLPSILSKISALQISDFSMLNRSAHTLRYRRFASILTDANARLAVEVVVSLLPPVGLSPTTLRQLAWRTDRSRVRSPHPQPVEPPEFLSQERRRVASLRLSDQQRPT